MQIIQEVEMKGFADGQEIQEWRRRCQDWKPWYRWTGPHLLKWRTLEEKLTGEWGITSSVLDLSEQLRCSNIFMWKCWVDSLIHDSWRKNWARDRHLSVVSLGRVVEAMAVGEIIYERVLNNIIIHFTSMCWVPHVPAPCLLWHTPNTDALPAFMERPGQRWAWQWLTLMNEPLQVEASTLTGRKRFCERREYRRAGPKLRNSFAIQGLIVDAASRPISPYPASLPEALLLEWPLPPLLPALFLHFPSLAGLCSLRELSTFSYISSFTISPCSKHCQPFQACQARVLPYEHSWSSGTPISLCLMK